LVFVIVTAALPPSPSIFYVLPHSKVAPILILISLMDRASLELQQRQGKFSDTTVLASGPLGRKARGTITTISDRERGHNPCEQPNNYIRSKSGRELFSLQISKL
jgi:hypothetical protein